MHLEPWQWIFGAASALLIGISKTGLPGAGILVVIVLANVFGGRASVGIMLPMLIFGDCFAVAWYRQHAHWDKLVGLLPWVVVGMAVGAAALWATGRLGGSKDVLSILIGILVLLMLGLYVMQGRVGERLTPKSKVGVASTGTAAGFATTVSNAAGPIMNIYMTAQRVSKEEFIGTLAWYYFVVNVSKLPIYFVLTAMNPQKPIITPQSLLFNVITFPAILAGVFVGKWLLPRMPQKLFDRIILTLAAASAIKLILG